ncbi:MAG: Rid family hydrolase [Bacteroidaceae bacterium]|nr:Rid family hydrolase [Bacteroidaceae bacterium]
MEYKTLNSTKYSSRIELTRFVAGDVEETHAMLHVEAADELFEGQLHRLNLTLQEFMAQPETSGANMVFMRYFLSDATNQAPLIANTHDCTVSFIQQPPLNGSKVALWIYLQKGTDVSNMNGSTVVSHNGYRHIWTMGLTNTSVDTSYMQTWKTMLSYIDTLKLFGATLKDNCIRTWFYVRDVDTQYGGLVKSRRECFMEQGLTADTHYIASTGIGGTPADPKAIIQMGCYAITGFEAEQQRYLYALTHLNKTEEYGVTFERATLMQYGDRDHIYISGTASINNKGEVVHVGDVRKQTYRMWENVEKLLEEGGMAFDDIMQIIVYLRDGADYKLVQKLFEEKFPDKPCVITLAPVCRPTWLIEMECIAVKKAQRGFRKF